MRILLIERETFVNVEWKVEKPKVEPKRLSRIWTVLEEVWPLQRPISEWSGLDVGS